MTAAQVFLLFTIGFGIASMGYAALRFVFWVFDNVADRIARKRGAS